MGFCHQRCAADLLLPRGSLAGLGSLFSACSLLAPQDVPDCWPGMEEGMRVELTLVAEYSPSSPYTWVEGPRPEGAPSCEGIDGLALGTYTFELGANQAIGIDCRHYPVVSSEPPLGTVDLTRARASHTYLSAEVPHWGGWWRFHAFRVGDDDAFGEEAIEGMLPPLIVQRTISGDHDCFDEWVGEVRRAPSAGDP